MPWGEEYTGATLVDMYLAELAAHAWDLARATGQPDLARATGQLDRLDPSLALPALDGARAMIKPQYRNMVELGAPFGGGGAAASRRQRLGTPRRLHGTRPPSIARPVRVAGGGPARSPSRRQAPKIWGFLGVTVMRVLFGWMMVKDLRRAAGHVGAGGGGGGGWGYMLGCPEIR